MLESLQSNIEFMETTYITINYLLGKTKTSITWVALWSHYSETFKTIAPIIFPRLDFSHSFSIDARLSELQNFFKKYGRYWPFKRVVTSKVRTIIFHLMANNSENFRISRHDIIYFFHIFSAINLIFDISLSLKYLCFFPSVTSPFCYLSCLFVCLFVIYSGKFLQYKCTGLPGSPWLSYSNFILITYYIISCLSNKTFINITTIWIWKTCTWIYIYIVRMTSWFTEKIFTKQ